MENLASDNQSDFSTEIKNVVAEKVSLCNNTSLAVHLQKAIPELIKLERRGTLHGTLKELSEETLLKLSKIRKHGRRVAFQIPRYSEPHTEVSMDEYITSGYKNKLLTNKFVKNLPVHMKDKRHYRKSILTFERKPWHTQFYDFIEKHWNDILPKFYIWQEALKTIEGRHGAAVVAYFVFIRWLLLMNIIIFMLTFFFLVIPESIYHEPQLSHIHRDSSITYNITKHYAETIKQSSAQNIGTRQKGYELFNFIFSHNADNSDKKPSNLSLEHIISMCERLYDEQLANSTDTGFIVFLQNLLQGTGPLQSTYLFMGSYSDTFHSSQNYSIPSAFLFVLLAALVICLIMMIK